MEEEINDKCSARCMTGWKGIFIGTYGKRIVIGSRTSPSCKSLQHRNQDDVEQQSCNDISLSHTSRYFNTKQWRNIWITYQEIDLHLKQTLHVKHPN